MFRKILRKLINHIYGFNLNELNPSYEIPLYYYCETIDVDGNTYEPTYMSDGAVGFDMICDLGERDYVEIRQSECYKFSTGLYLELPNNHEGRVVSRSGLSCDYQLIMVNGIGEIDWDYRGMVCVTVKNISGVPITIRHGERIAQMVVCRVARVKPYRLPSKTMLSKTKRGNNGHGSTTAKNIRNHGGSQNG